jgi:protein ImuB
LERLLEALCDRLQKEGKGLRQAVFKCVRVDDKTETVAICTNHASHHAAHLFKLFAIKIGNIEPALGIELFILQAPTVEDINPLQETFWAANSSLESSELAELLEGLQSKFGQDIVQSLFASMNIIYPNVPLS